MRFFFPSITKDECITKDNEREVKVENLQTLELVVKFCFDFYFKLFFDIKVKHLILDAPYHILTG